MKIILLFIGIVIGIGVTNSCSRKTQTIEDHRFYTKIVDPAEEHIQFYWKNDEDQIIGTFQALKEHLYKKEQQLVYAMNGGMFLKDQSPQGLYIENGVVLKEMDTTQTAYGNFYLQPNGVFYLTKDGKAHVSASKELSNLDNIDFATQSGPMLVIDGKLHPAFNKGSKNVHIRNVVGILPNGNILFAISKEKINLYDMATFFKNQGCKNALYLDGFVSRIYDKELHIEQMDVEFGVMIGITK